LDTNFIKLHKESLVCPITHIGHTKDTIYLYNLSIKHSVVPPHWKIGHNLATPIFKSGSRSDINNYRPISIFMLYPKLLKNG